MDESIIAKSWRSNQNNILTSKTIKDYLKSKGLKSIEAYNRESNFWKHIKCPEESKNTTPYMKSSIQPVCPADSQT